MRPEAVTFDFHDTLVICDDWFQLEIRDLLPAFLAWCSTGSDRPTLEVDPEEAVDRYRRLRMVVMEHGLEVDAVTGVETVLGDMHVQISSELIELGVREIMCEALSDARPVPGVVDAVKSLKRQGVRLGVVSSAVYHPFLEWSLEKFGMLDDFDTVVTSASCGYYKSRTEIYSITLDQLASIPRRSVHIGDSLLYDVNTASKLDMLTVWYAKNGHDASDVAADAVVTSLEGVDQTILDIYRERRS